MTTATPCRSCGYRNGEMSLADLEQLARDTGTYPPERDEERRRFVVNLAGAEFFARFGT